MTTFGLADLGALSGPKPRGYHRCAMSDKRVDANGVERATCPTCKTTFRRLATGRWKSDTKEQS